MDEQVPMCIPGLCNVRTCAKLAVICEFAVSVSIDHLTIGTVVI